MLPKSKKVLFTALASVSMLFSSSIVAQDKGLISIIVNDMSNPYWQTEGTIAERTAEELGYDANVSSHVGDTNTESNQVDTAITNGAKAIILDPANAWAMQLDGEGSYIELKGPPSDNNAATRSNGYETVLSQYPDLSLAASDIANWDRTEGRNKMQSMLRSHPDIRGVISGNDEMALGAIVALKQEGRLDDVIVGGFDGSPDAVDAVRSGELAYTVLQPVAVFAEHAVKIADHYINTGETGLDSEKQLYDCILITPDNVDNYTSPFVLEE